ncbi:hypothetical protein THRCLA_05809 [Thraustotheca clavata]|uniref:Uncharacterized protein n=1 Tax=Thraustotheca clavata TaxID=74557 RepID=A0A1V9ZSJ2_9STRA|nr:hypothetical protein THRCLA_05809 [Thraustotheca clavata]
MTDSMASAPMLKPAGYSTMTMTNPPIAMANMQPIAMRLPVPEEPKLVFLKEVQATKHRERNILSFQIKSGASILYSIMKPPSHSYEAPDATWIKLLEAVALIPSGKPESMTQLLKEAYGIIPLVDFRILFARDFKEELDATTTNNKRTARDGVIIKNKVNIFLRAFMADPVHGYTLVKHHIQDGLFLDDIVQTPAGYGYVRAYRASDGFYTVLYPFGHGYVHESNVGKIPSELFENLLKEKRSREEAIAMTQPPQKCQKKCS